MRCTRRDVSGLPARLLCRDSRRLTMFVSCCNSERRGSRTGARRTESSAANACWTCNSDSVRRGRLHRMGPDVCLPFHLLDSICHTVTSSTISASPKQGTGSVDVMAIAATEHVPTWRHLLAPIRQRPVAASWNGLDLSSFSRNIEPVLIFTEYRDVPPASPNACHPPSGGSISKLQFPGL